MRQEGKKHPTNRGFYYYDADGRRWAGGWCPDCKREKDTAYSRKQGRRSVDKQKFPSLAKARNNERIAAKHLKHLGVRNVVLGNGKGPDITGRILSGIELTFEVKTVVRQSTNAGLWVHKVQPTRELDDYIIYVHEGKCIIRDMCEHLAECWVTGACRVTQWFP